MKKLSLIIIVLSLAACGSSNSKMSKDRFVVENLTNYDTEELAETYPEANIQEDTGMFEEGTVERAYTIMYPDTPDELHITWKSEEREEIYDIRFSENGKWKSAEGIEIGTTYEALYKLNEKEISFYGFGWDYGGAVMWNDGKFEKSKLRVFLAPDGEVSDKFYGDRIIEASEEEIERLDLKVTSIMLVN
ncbi:hypothetical protein [Salegentibacter salegens]|uniref:Lipoprotein n=1 Tax=Salegentibacter salegens TaxID=143223 RepID=A0A1M7LWQ2_9FLAO|nr:hypothetical protein [Salegentibacter salegens]PRX52134.1 hypothetical protein LY58_00298 [Salegentibacter salegens]SHM82677.1 hypothetical protein SAMN05878281_2131 [Salegentibacter salegens]